jgi:release factor glutamine methyltransferase
VVAVNAPYVPSEAVALMPPEARDHEHLVALDGGADGLDVHRRVVRGAGEWLAPGGVLLIEASRAQAPVTAGLMGAVGLEARIEHDDDIGGTCVIGRRPR